MFFNAVPALHSGVQQYKRRQSVAPGYLIDLRQLVASTDGRGHLRFASRGQLQVPRIKMTTYGNRAFEHAGSSPWNALPNTLKYSSHCLPTFRRHVKHFYFSFY